MEALKPAAAAPKRYNCKIRNHKWDRAPGPGAVCELCKRQWVGVHRGPRGGSVPTAAPAAPSPAAAPMGQVIDLSKVRERWGIAAPTGATTGTSSPTPAQPMPASATAEEAKAEATTVTMGKLSEWLGEPLAEFMVELARRRIERKGFEPNAPDHDWEEKLQECVTKLLQEKLPQIEMKPFTGALVAWAAVYVSMRWRARPLDNAERKELNELRAFKAKQQTSDGSSPSQAGPSPSPSSGPGVAPAAPASTNEPAAAIASPESTEFPGYSLPQNNNWLTGEGGGAMAAAASASAA